MGQGRRPLATSPLEWIAAALGALIALSLLGVLGWEAAAGTNGGPPELTVRALRAVPAAHGFVVEVEVRNRADPTAAAVGIEGVLKRGYADVETSRATIDYVPGRGRRRVGLLFTRDPAVHRLELRATGYQEP